MNKKSNWCQYLPGLMIAVFAAGLSMVLGKAVPILGSSLFAILCGILLSASQVLPQTSRSGLSYSGKKLLQYSIILMGFTLSFQKVTKLGLSSLGFCSGLPFKSSKDLNDLGWNGDSNLWRICNRGGFPCSRS